MTQSFPRPFAGKAAIAASAAFICPLSSYQPVGHQRTSYAASHFVAGNWTSYTVLSLLHSGFGRLWVGRLSRKTFRSPSLQGRGVLLCALHGRLFIDKAAASKSAGFTGPRGMMARGERSSDAIGLSPSTSAQASDVMPLGLGDLDYGSDADSGAQRSYNDGDGSGHSVAVDGGRVALSGLDNPTIKQSRLQQEAGVSTSAGIHGEIVEEDDQDSLFLNVLEEGDVDILGDADAQELNEAAASLDARLIRREGGQPASSGGATQADDSPAEVDKITGALGALIEPPPVVIPTFEHVSSFLTPNSPDLPLILIVLNYSLPSITPSLWYRTTMTVCADGAANRLYDSMPGLVPHLQASVVRKSFVPNVIKGDLDSLRPEVADYYAKLGSEVIEDSNQDTTDFQKCLELIQDRVPEAELAKTLVLVVGGLGGRIDHELSNLHTLHMYPEIRMILLKNSGTVRLLPPGRHVIKPALSVEGPVCGLIPLGAPCSSVSSVGLKWNLANHRLAIGSCVSSSNQIVSDTVEVETDNYLLWTTAIESM